MAKKKMVALMLLCVFVKTFVGFAQNTLHWKFIDDKSHHITITVQYLWYNELLLITTFIYQKKKFSSENSETHEDYSENKRKYISCWQ